MSVRKLDVDDGTIGSVLPTLLLQPGSVAPVLIVEGVDRVGRDREGALPLDYPPETPRKEQRVALHELGKKAATWEPYFATLRDIYHLRKATLNLRTKGLQEKEEAIIMTIFTVVQHAFTVKVFTGIRSKEGMLAGERCSSQARAI
jgi:hypothetical protein